MRAIYYEAFQSPLRVVTLPDPKTPDDGVVIRVKATGICRSDWHGWMGHDGDICLPHVPGHEFAGEIVSVGKMVPNWYTGEAVTVPFCLGCGHCMQCASGNQQICDNYYQPGFTGWGSFAEYVAIPHATLNLVKMPIGYSFEAIACLGCRFITAYRAVTAQGKVGGGKWLTVFGCGGIGLASIMIAHARGASVIAVDINPRALALAKKFGATITLNAKTEQHLIDAIKTHTNGGSHVAIDALGSHETCQWSIQCLRKQGRQVQVGLLLGKDKNPPIPMDLVIANELEIYGSHGMQAHVFPEMFALIAKTNMPIESLIQQTISLEEACTFLPNMNQFQHAGITVINKF